jgi:hypothetical protein
LFDTKREITTHEITVVVYVKKERIEAVVNVVNRERPIAAVGFFDLDFLAGSWVSFGFISFSVTGSAEI